MEPCLPRLYKGGQGPPQNTSTPKSIQATTQDVGYYALRGPNLYKSLCFLHHRVSELVDPLPTILLLRVSLSRLMVLYLTKKFSWRFTPSSTWKPIRVGCNRHGKVCDDYPSWKWYLPCHSIRYNASVMVTITEEYYLWRCWELSVSDLSVMEKLIWGSVGIGINCIAFVVVPTPCKRTYFFQCCFIMQNSCGMLFILCSTLHHLGMKMIHFINSINGGEYKM